MKKRNIKFSEATELLYEGEKINGCDLTPESAPIFLTTAFTMGNLENVQNTYDEKGYTYVRTRNPNRNSLAEAISFLEKGKYSLIFSSGMGAITTTYFSVLKPGDHFIANENIYGETFDAINLLLVNYGVSVDYVDFTNLEAVKSAIKPNTKMIYTEVASNPTDRLSDIEELGKIAHANGAMLMVDNTFTTPIAIKPMTLGADIVINSLTKFINGHSDALAGSITVNDKEIFDKIHTIRMLTGTSGCPFSAWTVYRGIHTMDLRVRKQMKNAALLAKSLEDHPAVLKVNHPSLDSNPQAELAKKLFKNKETMTGMLSFEMPDDRQKINEFMDRLSLAHYAPTLGGIRTTLSHPLHSSHHHVPKEDLYKMGISYGLMRISVGIEDIEDLISDFNYALEVFQ
ncbi:aminotransferase class I/II-fold pyridoxal phosphate-dependent enzyme [Clostridium pasteurianum]|uniref:trans-sulfuration enzyme family protein n=1 Tax=Clostridium pasteurianum TaxID=1501 RepID=UPI0022608877|nr:aminotransferase class I/II-fold pyridoxal phosphate-dependent enzyme [Clostridium pasteurianum]UZW15458.1 aminotransferase class I/II-fold pyridoxal phosphate-dependent enzyme [Clostridium pasteurianum]